MTLLYLDSFDHYTTLLDKWTFAGGVGGQSISAGNGRAGTAALARAYTNAGYIMSRPFPATDVIVVGFAFKMNVQPADALQLPYIPHFVSDTGNPEITLFFLQNHTLQIRRGVALTGAPNSGTLLATGTIPLAIGAWYYVEIKLFCDNAGTCEVKVNGVTDINFAGDTLNVSANLTNLAFGGANACQVFYVDDLYICDDSGADNNDFLGDLRVDALLPDGVGNSSDFTPSAGANWQCVDENPPNDDADYVEEATINDHDTYTFENTPIAAGTLYGLQQAVYARKDDAGFRTLKGMIRSGGADYEGTDLHPLSDSYLYFLEIFEQDPDTAAAWLVAGLNAGEFGQILEA